jgi:hypothetical protein
MNKINECYGQSLQPGISCLSCPGTNEAGKGFDALCNEAFLQEASNQPPTTKIPVECLPRLKQSRRWQRVIDYTKSDQVDMGELKPGET